MTDMVFQTIYQLNNAELASSFSFACGVKKRVVTLDRIAGEMFGVLICKVSGMLGEDIPGSGNFTVPCQTLSIVTLVVEHAYRISQELAYSRKVCYKEFAAYAGKRMQELKVTSFNNHAEVVEDSFDIFLQYGLMKLEEYDRSIIPTSQFPVRKPELLLELFAACYWWWNAIRGGHEVRLN